MLLLFIIALSLVYIYLKFFCFEYWNKRGVPGPKPNLLFGNIKDSFFLKKSFGQVFADIYQEHPDLPIVGIYRANTPILIPRDPDLVRDVLVKEFSSFHDNDRYVDLNVDPLFGRNPFNLRGAHWKKVRTQLTPGLTNVKIKTIYPFLEETSREFVKYLGKLENAFNGKGINAQEACGRFTLNNVASIAFGVEGKCFEETNSEFIKIGKSSPFHGWAAFKLYLITMIPVLQQLISVRYFTVDVEERIKEIISESLKYRSENNIIRNDYLDHLIQAMKSSNDFKDIDIAAHSTGLLVDGFETSSTVMHYFLYEIGLHPEVQAKVRQEINEKFEENNGTIPFEVLQNKMPYLEAAFLETIRLHPPLPTLGKTCTKPFVYNAKIGNTTTPITIEKGISLFIPLLGMQRDPKYFEEPEKYNIERFLGENKEKVPRYAFMPFGEGPRACFGRRFGMVQVKLALAHIVRSYEIKVNPRTKLPFRFSMLNLLAIPLDGIFVDLKKID